MRLMNGDKGMGYEDEDAHFSLEGGILVVETMTAAHRLSQC